MMIDSWQLNLSLICNKSSKYIALSQSIRTVGIGFVKPSFARGKFAIIGYPIKHAYHPLINSPESGHPPYFSLVSAYSNNSRKRTALITGSFFSIPDGVRLRES